jgi:2,4-dienoyl-CoA reductase-like NADH-dependent reductase (Old Yellow Enzyme family)
MSTESYPKVGHFQSVAEFRARLDELGIHMPLDEEIETAPQSPLAQTIDISGFTAGNRWAIHPMEGWDGTDDGQPSFEMERRWQRFGQSGAKIIWGGEAVSVRRDGRANPNQLYFQPNFEDSLERLRLALANKHQDLYGDTDDLFVGLQLTHSGRFSRPNDKKKLEPRIVYRHPILDRKFGIDSDEAIFSDDEIKRLIEDYHAAARTAQKAGFQFVDIKHCHGYLGHEFLSAFTRPGPYGGSFENRTRFLREIVAGIRAECPGLIIGVRLSAFDMVPYKPDPEKGTARQLGPGIPEDFSHCLPYRYAFSTNQENPIEPELSETFQFLELLRELDIKFVNFTAGSPYYNPHIQRPAIYPPSDGYTPPEDPLVGCARQINVVRQLKAKFPDIVMVGTAYTYLQEFLPNVAQAAVRENAVDVVGIGRMVLSLPELCADVLREGKMLNPKHICRTFSDCTTAPRNGLISGCFPLDEYYKKHPARLDLKRVKSGKSEPARPPLDEN